MIFYTSIFLIANYSHISPSTLESFPHATFSTHFPSPYKDKKNILNIFL